MWKWSGAGVPLLLFFWGCAVRTVAEKVCIGTKEGLTVTFPDFLERYQGCTHILGNFEIREYNLTGVNIPEHFLRNVREITGHLFIYRVQGVQLTFPSLRVIRGQNLLRVHVEDPEYAILAVHSNIDRLEFPVLSEVSRGSVGFYFGRRMCNLENVNWKDIISDKNSQFHYFISYSNVTGLYGNQLEDRTNSSAGCEKCNASCPNACWGEGTDKCQSLLKVHCELECGGGRCFGSGAGECCHFSCLGGCTGPNRSDCISCKGPYINGECQDACPSEKYSFSTTCVKTCPSGTVVDEELRACLAACPSNKYSQKGKCETVPPPGKLCRQASFSQWKIIHSGIIDNYKNCTILEGSIAITGKTFLGGSFQKNFTTSLKEQRMHPDRLNVFRSLQEISGDLKIVGNEKSQFVNLTSFSNLVVFGSGRAVIENYNVLSIDNTLLKIINFKNLRRAYGDLLFRYNKNLCYVDTIKWPNENGWRGNMYNTGNMPAGRCTNDGHNCSSLCSENGCWGGEPQDCVCPKYIWKEDRHVSECPEGTYLSGCNCLECHRNCRGGCGGPLRTVGDDGCKSCELSVLKGGGEIDCITNSDGCPRGYFYDTRNVRISKGIPDMNFSFEAVCILCHEYCDRACKGPSQELGELGCTSCQQEIDYENGTITCMKKGADCPLGYFLAVRSSKGNGLRQFVDTSVCKKCDPRCSNCTGYGNQIHEMICQECTFYRQGDFCEEECSVGFYADVENHECAPCAEECRSCEGPTSLECTTCNFYYVYETETSNNFDNATGNFTCVMECPPELPLQLKRGPNKVYCEKAIESAYWGNQLAVVGIALLLVVTLFGIGVQCCKQSKVMKIPEKVTKRENSVEASSVEKFELPPNLSKFRTFDAKNLRREEILGRGAFGTVYKGIWMPEEDVKIPVAIKALHGTSNASDSCGFINEAFIMAAIQHPNLLSMLGLCLGSSEIMLVSQLMPLGSLLHYMKANKDSIGSKSMLNWCIQIATGMEHLESSRIVHRDLAARNVVMETPNSIKITDFGLAKLLNLSTEQYQGQREMLPLKWLAPECFHGLSFSYKSDVWAFGVTVWEILTYGEVPFDDLPAEEVMATLDRGERLEQPDNCSIDMYLMLIKTWMPDPESRPSFKELVVDYTEMFRDPGRYLVIQNDELKRLPKYTLEDEQKLIRRLAGNWDRPDDVMTVEQYSRRDTKGYLLTESPANKFHYRDMSCLLNYPSMYQYPMEKGLSESENI